MWKCYNCYCVHACLLPDCGAKEVLSDRRFLNESHGFLVDLTVENGNSLVLHDVNVGAHTTKDNSQEHPASDVADFLVHLIGSESASFFLFRFGKRCSIYRVFKVSLCVFLPDIECCLSWCEQRLHVDCGIRFQDCICSWSSEFLASLFAQDTFIVVLENGNAILSAKICEDCFEFPEFLIRWDLNRFELFLVAFRVFHLLVDRFIRHVEASVWWLFPFDIRRLFFSSSSSSSNWIQFW